MKKIGSLALAGCMAASSLAMSAGAVNVDNLHDVNQQIERTDTSLSLEQLSPQITNLSSLSAAQANMLWEQAKNELVSMHEKVYSLDHFEAIFCDADDGGVDLDITADCTLLVHPENNPYFQGMQAAINTLSNTEKDTVQNICQAQYEDALAAYNTPVQATYLLHAEKPQTHARSESYNLMARLDVLEDEPVLYEIDKNLVKTGDAAEESGYQFVLDTAATVEDMPMAYASYTYNRMTAAQYAIDHGTDYPEMVSLGYGSDCANFVSYCLSAGGIPRDWSNFNDGWYNSVNGKDPSRNWMRTGYNNNGGVRPYMVNKGYFRKSSVTSGAKGAFAGCFLYQTNSSHVAFVTYGDGSTVRISDHSDYQKSSTNYVCLNMNVYDVYIPTSYTNN